MAAEFGIDALVPVEMARKAEEVGVKKANLPIFTTLILAVLAGAFVAVGAIFATTVGAGSLVTKAADGSVISTTALPYGLVGLLKGLVFSVGLILVVVGGAELFTGNNLIVMAFSSGKVTLGQLLLNWLIVYTGNFIGSLATVVIVFLSKQYLFGSGAMGLAMLNAGETKTSYPFLQALMLGIMCNTLVCLAVWLCYSARTTTDKIMAIIFPITAFVAAGFEHSVANMYFIPMALFVKQWGDPALFEMIHKTAADFPHLTWGNFVGNLIPVTIGNIIGGAVMVGLVYWLAYLRPGRK